jgi:hypothetical protein
MALAKIAGVEIPPAVTSVTAEDGVVRVVADLRRLDELPAALRLAVKVAPIVRAEVRILSYDGRRATLGVEVNAARLPAHKLLGLLSEPIEHQLVKQGLPAGAVDVRSDATVVVDVERLLAEKAPGVDVTRLAIDGEQLVVDASVA